jgi:hypothetical protein
MAQPIEYTIFFTSVGGYSAKITGDELALSAIEEAFERAGIKFNDELETWDEGYYTEEKAT